MNVSSHAHTSLASDRVVGVGLGGAGDGCTGDAWNCCHVGRGADRGTLGRLAALVINVCHHGAAWRQGGVGRAPANIIKHPVFIFGATLPVVILSYSISRFLG